MVQGHASGVLNSNQCKAQGSHLTDGKHGTRVMVNPCLALVYNVTLQYHW